MGTVSFPLGPSTANSWPIVTLTPFGNGMGLFPTRDIIHLLARYHSWHRTSPPTRSLRAEWPVMTPRGVVRMLMPKPPKTLGTSRLATYTRQPGLDTRSIREITGTLPGVYF